MLHLHIVRYVTRAGVMLLAAAFITARAAGDEPIYTNLHRTFDERAADLVSHMTLEEKISQLRNDAPAIPRLGVPAYEWWNEALHGVARAGAATGNAVADVLFGDVSPSGRVPVTFYKETEKLPAFDDYDMKGRTYRYFGGEPLYPFGYGLSYSRFEYSDLVLDRSVFDAEDTIHVTVTVKNSGARTADEIAQLYIRPIEPKVQRAQQDLRGIERVSLQPRESRRITFAVQPKMALRRYDPAVGSYVVYPGRYEIQIGSSSRDIGQARSFTIGK